MGILGSTKRDSNDAVAKKLRFDGDWAQIYSSMGDAAAKTSRLHGVNGPKNLDT